VRPLRAGVCLALLAILPPAALSQATTAELGGFVRDPGGLPVAAAAITLRHTATGLTVTQASGPEGDYHFPALPAGSYVLTATRVGFAPLRRDGIGLRVGDRATVDLDLVLGDASQAVEVSAAPPLLQSARGTVSFVVEQQKVVTLPLDGRNFVPLLALSPGVTLPPGGLLPRINGSRPRVSEYLYDGISVLQPEPGQVAYYPILDAIEEFRVETNSYAAEYGRSNGGVILVTQKSGTNTWRGTVFEFFRNERLNARNRFAPPGAKPRFRRNQHGLVLGGPLARNRTFLFADWQGTRLETGVVRTSTVPTIAERSGLFTAAVFDPATTRRSAAGYARDPFPANRIPAARFDPVAQAVAVRYPAPNVDTTANNYRRLANERTAAEQFDVRGDHYQSPAQRFFSRYAFLRDHSRPASPLPDGGGNLTTGVPGDTVTRADSVAGEHTWTPRPAIVNQFRAGYTARRLARRALRIGQSATAATGIPHLPASSFADVLPTFDIIGLQQLGPPANSNARFATAVLQIANTFSWMRGAHQGKAGVDLRRQTLNVLQPAHPTGNFQFPPLFTGALAASGAVSGGSSFGSFLLGQVGRFSLDAQPEVLRPRAQTAEFFLQDDWRVSRRLSWNPGLRYTLNLPSTVVGDQGAVFNLNTERLDLLGSHLLGSHLLGSPGQPRAARRLEKRLLAPRVGVAFLLRDSLVLRSGYSLTWIEQAGITTPFTTPLFPFVQSLGQQTLDNLTPAFLLAQGPTVRPQAPGPDAGLGQGVFGVQRDNGSGYAQQWNLSVQKSFGAHWSVEVGYLGSKLTRLGVPDGNLNQLTVEQLALGAPLTQAVANPWAGLLPAGSPLGGPMIPRAQLLRPFPRFTTVALYRNNVGHSTYHSAQARAEKRLARGLTLTLAYTFSRLIDDAGAVFDSALLSGPVANFQAADSFNRRLEKDVSTGNVPHNFSAGFVYERAGRSRWLRGWQVAGMVRAQSGSPVAVTQANNLNAFAGFGVQRPNRVANPQLARGERSTARWFDTAAFRPAPQFTLGNSSRNPVVGPGYRAVDLMVGRSFRLGEARRLELRAEAFNAMNTPLLGNPNGSFGAPGFGSITTALDPRVWELVAKFHF
jgi:hypothetical protein